MDQILVISAFVLVGLCFGSFVNALVWRLHAGRNFVSERSECTHCHHVLGWYDLVPLLSWLWLRGRCRYCHRVIDDSPVVELAGAALFVVSYLVWPYGFASSLAIGLFVLWLVAVVILLALADYDVRWQLLPDVMVFPLVVLAGVIGVMRSALEGLPWGWAVGDMLLGVAVIAGLYYALYHVSHHRWVGFGDVKLGVAIGLALGGQGALVALFAANLLGTAWVLPGLMIGRLTRRSRVPFGPFLIAGWLVAMLWGHAIVAWYLQPLILL